MGSYRYPAYTLYFALFVASWACCEPWSSETTPLPVLPDSPNDEQREMVLTLITAWILILLGTMRDQMPGVLPIPFPMGVASLGGPLITAGGVVFYSGTLDNYLRAYDVTTGRKLWQSRPPAGGQATPMTYRIHGRQMVVVAAGGHGSFGTTPGDTVLAYELK